MRIVQNELPVCSKIDKDRTNWCFSKASCPHLIFNFKSQEKKKNRSARKKKSLTTIELKVKCVEVKQLWRGLLSLKSTCWEGCLRLWLTIRWNWHGLTLGLWWQNSTGTQLTTLLSIKQCHVSGTAVDKSTLENKYSGNSMPVNNKVKKNIFCQQYLKGVWNVFIWNVWSTESLRPGLWDFGSESSSGHNLRGCRDSESWDWRIQIFQGAKPPNPTKRTV